MVPKGTLNENDMSKELTPTEWMDTLSNNMFMLTDTDNIIKIPKMYPLDASKIESIEDLRKVIAALELKISDRNPMYEEIKHLLKEPE